MKVIIENDTIKVKSEYNKEFIKKARLIQGKWSSPYWVFPAENKEQVKEALLQVYGECGDLQDDIARVTVELNLDEYDYDNHDGVKIGDITVAIRTGRDQAVRLSSNTMLISGGFPESGGSAKYPAVDAEKGTVIRVKNIPEILYEKIKNNSGVRLIDNSIDTDALAAEKEKLLARIAEIDSILAK